MAAQPELDLQDPEDPSADLPASTDADDDYELDGRPSLDNGQSPPNQTPAKRKGGRKPVYATVEERKQRNRQAQAAFRERRTEYIKQLEVTLKQNEQLLQSVQNDQHAVAHECTSLRHKISAMEKIMNEKGIDIQAELRAKGESLDMTTPSYLSLHKSKAYALPLPPADATPYQPRRNVRGLAPKLDLRSKMAQLQANHASPTDPQTARAMPWQHTAPADAIELSPAAAQFRGLPSPIYGMPGQAFPEQKGYDAHPSEFDGQHMTQTIPGSPSYPNPVAIQHENDARLPPQPPDAYAQVPAGFIMNGVSRLAPFDYNPQSQNLT